MTTITSQPKVFISSTISDMFDLRSATKYWLEELGYDVQVSEFNDFQRKPELGTFDACFEAIRASDYYILLIGKKRGSWYDEPNRISVTRKEYRVASESAKILGKPRIISLVRSCHWSTGFSSRRANQT